MSHFLDTLLTTATRSEPVLITHGRDLADLEPTTDGIMPLVESMRNTLLERGYLLLEFSRSRGLVADLASFAEEDRTRINAVIALLGTRANKANANPSEEERFGDVLQGLTDLGRQDRTIHLVGGRELRLFLLVHYAEHIIPDLEAAQLTPERMRILEGLLDLSKRLTFIRSGHIVCLNESRQALTHRLLRQHLPTFPFPLPDRANKSRFVDALQVRYPEARTADGLTVGEVANLSAGTHNHGLHGLWKSSAAGGDPISRREIFQRRQEDVSTQSEGTLLALDQEQNARIQLTGSMIQRPSEVVMKVAEGIRNNVSSTLRNLVFVGAPSTGKTQLAMRAAALAGVPIFSMETGRAMYVGESERRTRLQLQLLRDQSNCMAILDELEHLLPMDRSQQSGDSGVSQSLQGMYQTFLADASLSGRVALLGTSNRPFAISEAMRQRWVFLPVFSALREDLAGILKAMLAQLGVNDASQEALTQAADIFHQRSASPREMREAYIAARSLAAPTATTDETILLAARSMIGGTDHGSVLLGDLSALQFCRSDLYLPWHDGATGVFDPAFPIPAHIKEFIHPETGVIDNTKLEGAVNDLRSRVNI
jgi:hypothetical protein